MNKTIARHTKTKITKFIINIIIYKAKKKGWVKKYIKCESGIKKKKKKDKTLKLIIDPI